VVIGSQAILGQFPAHGVAEETAVLPAGWRGRLVLISNENTRSSRGWCLEVHDLAISKLVAGREKPRMAGLAKARLDAALPAW
jgi:hypothetical protein